MKTTTMNTKTIQRDLQQLDEKIARSRRTAAFHRVRAIHANRFQIDAEVDYLAEAYERDAEDLQAVRDAVAQDDLAQAGRIAYGLDTYVRDEIPKRLFNAIMKANGTNS